MTRFTQNGPREVVTTPTETVGERIGRVLATVGVACIALVITAGVLAYGPALLAAMR